jgi:2-methylcitrate dehydratase PrpD
MPQLIAQKLADFSSRLDSRDIPDEVFEKAKSGVLDTVGLCMAASRLDFGIAVSRLVHKWSGTPEATTIGSSPKVPGQSAAFCNGVLAHGQDYDETHTESVVHSSAALVPAALAVAESLGASGADMLTALIAGAEAAIRIALPAKNKFHQRGFHTTSVATTFGSALIACKLYRMSSQQTAAALGTCGSVLSGLVECVPAGANAKRLHAGWAAHAGIVAAQFAREGFEGPASIFDGKYGLYNSMLSGESLDLNSVVEGLGKHWELLDTRPKLYPCCHMLQAYIDCADALRREPGVSPDNIEKISCRASQGAANIVCEPWANKQNPVNSYSARFSLPFAVAVMLVTGKAGDDEFSEDVVADPAIRNLMNKTSYQIEPKYQVKDMSGWVEIQTRSGATYRHEIPVLHGDRTHPIPADALMQKFRTNAKALPAESVSEIAAAVQRLEKMADVGALMAKLGRAA